MASKGEHVLEWSDEMELAFINIMLEKFKVTKTTSWKRPHWEEMTKEIEKQFPEAQLCWTKLRDKCARLKGTYMQFTELRNHTGMGWDADTDTIMASPDVWDMFIKRSNSVSSPKKPKKNSVNEAMLELKKLKEKVPHRFYVKVAMALADKEIRKVFMFLDEDERIEWLQDLADS
ncbi:hypothetical protein CRG98_013359 [Punica granatum]|uniref:Myb/SANT-like domain-containing protein n=1 Tax=Punica granatum TaxID=22663 RepID=A0A2I0KCL6_PUNGR|nr:hypothetical protein CRG98_013359 [Punica granatum]